MNDAKNAILMAYALYVLEWELDHEYKAGECEPACFLEWYDNELRGYMKKIYCEEVECNV